MGRFSTEMIFQQCESGIAELQRLGGLPVPAESRSIWHDIWHREAHHSTAIEGNTLVLNEVKELLDQGKAVGAKPLAEYLEVAGYGDAATWVYSQALGHGTPAEDEAVTATDVRRIHQLVMAPVWERSPHEAAGQMEGPGLGPMVSWYLITNTSTRPGGSGCPDLAASRASCGTSSWEPMRL